ncbi:MAG: type II toxin-antitoxin system HicB family antitoxin [Clostridia bacterium]|nr:type II toxin-antitoxin system HicB family antitoxin [Deltaproteobacteria bacterium]
MRFRVRIGREPGTGTFVTYVPTLGISTYGDTRAEALSMTAEAIEGYVEAARKEGIGLDEDVSDAGWADVDVSIDAA